MQQTLNLSDVTLIIYDPRAHKLAQKAIDSITKNIRFNRIITMSDQLHIIKNRPTLQTFIPVPGDESKELGQSRLWTEAHNYIETSHILNVEWDSGIVNPLVWTDEFLEYDYIGAPWPWHPADSNIGNGGFSLLSKRLLFFLSEFRLTFPHIFPWDDTLCRKYRKALQKLGGFRWAPEDLASRFSREHGPMRDSFGFHDCRNWPLYLSNQEIESRILLANDFIRAHPAWKAMLESRERHAEL